MQAALPMGANKITGAADPTVSTDVATKNYVDTTTAAFFSTGDVKLTLKTAADAGWLLFDDGTFGSASSGSSNSNNIANLALFTLLFNAPFTDANIPILTSGGGATTRAAQVSASAAWAANCRMSLPKTLGRALAIAGSGSGLTARIPGQALGEETHLQTVPELPAHSHGINDPGHNHSYSTPTGSVDRGSGAGLVALPNGTQSTGNAATGISIQSTGGGTAFNVMQPTAFLNAMVKI